MSQPKAIHFGAGNIGRGFIGPILVKSTYHVIFADIDQDIIHELNTQGSYNLYTLDDHTSRQSISSMSGVFSQTSNIISQFSDPNVRIVTTSVGASVLKSIAPLIAEGLQARRKAGAGALNIIACENMIQQTTQLSHYVSAHLSLEDKSWVDEHIGFANCSVDRIIPPTDSAGMESPLDVAVEEFYEWIVDGSALSSRRSRVCSSQPTWKGTLRESCSRSIVDMLSQRTLVISTNTKPSTRLSGIQRFMRLCAGLWTKVVLLWSKNMVLTRKIIRNTSTPSWTSSITQI
jgi:mannitol-1-phosphate/altronate dehydrogenase